jgi:hypothetical protein
VRLRVGAALSLALLAACAVPTDPATRLAADLEAGADRLRLDEGATDSVHHATPSRAPHVDTPRSYIVDKGTGETLIVDLERRSGRAVITDVR